MRKVIFVLNWLAAIGLVFSYSACWISPEHISWLGLFGLAYPALLGLNICFLLFWLLVGPLKALLPALVIVAGYGVHSNFFAWNEGTEMEEGEGFKVITYNVRLFDYYNWTGGKDTRNAIFNLLKERTPDVVCFQEFYYTEKPGVFETRDTLKKVLGLTHLHDHYSHHLTGKQHFGLAIYSRYDIVNEGVINFESDINNFAVWADLRMGSDTIRVFNAHLASIRFKKEDYELVEKEGRDADLDDGKRFASRLISAFEKRAVQTEAMIKEVRKSPHPVVLAGDFNDTPVSFCYSAFTSFLKDSFKEAGRGIGNTYIGKFPSFRIDYVLHSQELRAASYSRLPDELSDHHAVEVVLVKGSISDN